MGIKIVKLTTAEPGRFEYLCVSAPVLMEIVLSMIGCKSVAVRP